MNKRVFQIDQECFIIYVEELSSKKERFLRIGNSAFLKEFGENLTFVTLLSKIYPGDPFHELDIFRPDVDRKIIGLRDITKRFLYFLKENNININKVNIVYAEEAGNLFKEVKSEEDFLKKIEHNKKISKHSFASFYSDGNIRIFNKNEVIFDLLESMYNKLNESQEIKRLAYYFLRFYKESYNKNGIIHSNGSLFVFSENNFACITDSSSWVKDAVRVGIDPTKLDLLYLTEKTTPGVLCLKSILNRDKDAPKIKLIHNEKIRWEKLLSPDNVLSLNTTKKSISHKLGNINLNFKEDKITISSSGYKLFLEINDTFLDKGNLIKGKYSESNIKKDLELIIDDFKKDSITLYSCNPLIFEKFIDENNYISKFWENFPVSVLKNNSLNILSDDSEYSEDFIPDIKSLEFYPKLYTETLRRINSEGSKNISDKVFKEYSKILKGFSGNEINKNTVIIEQILGYGINEKRVCARDFLGSKEITYFNEDINPFLNFQKKAEKKEWLEMQDEYRKNYRKNIDNNAANLIGNRFTEIIDSKQFYIEERERLKRFMESVIIKEKQKESLERAKKQKETGYAKDKKEDLDKTRKVVETFETGSFFEKLKNKKVFFIAALFLLALLIGLLFLLPFNFNKDIRSFFSKQSKSIYNKVNETTKKLVLDKKREDRYIKSNNSENIKRSKNFKFFMTLLDLLNLTNVVAEKNGYHKIVEDFEKPFMTGKDPDWIYPGNVLNMPDSSRITVKKGDNMWKLCETFLINQINMHEVEIQGLIEKNKTGEISMEKLREDLLKIKDESYSEMLRDFIDEIVQAKDSDKIEIILQDLK